jgi:extracellular elastinolytic metalloproteinase
MTTNPVRNRRRRTAALALVTATLVPGLAQLPALASSTSAAPTPLSADDVTTLGDSVPGLSDLDVRGSVLPSLAQRRVAEDLGAVSLRWNDFGTPASILPAGGVLAKAAFPGAGAANAEKSARAWLEANAAVFGLSATQMRGLELVNAQELAAYDGAPHPGYAVLLRQRFGDLTPALGSMVTVGVARGEIAYVSSSLVRAEADLDASSAKLSPLQGWLAAARNVGRELGAGTVDDIVSSVTDDWTMLTVPGFAQPQQVRLRALAKADGTVRPVLEANVVDSGAGDAFAYTLLVDAVSGEVLHRENKVEHDQVNDVFTGAFTGDQCGPVHDFELADDKTRTINALGLSTPADDITVKIYGPGKQLLFTQDLLTSPELATYSSDKLKAGVYGVQVCPFDSASAVSGTYSLLLSTSDQAAPSTGGELFSPQWRYFTANPSMTSVNNESIPKNSVIGCWVAGPDCTLPTGPFKNVASTYPWDALDATGTTTATTVGNNANTHEAWASPLTPGGLFQAPVSPTREYTAEFTDAWNNSKCDPAQLRPGGNDIEFSTQNLFVSHNRMHDYSYYLGFTESNYNLQLENFGRGGVEGDQEIGNVQAGALSGGQPTYLGRDNANQITLQDGVPGITNQYLFQPIAGAFYAPCTDGGLDMGIVGHEYTHAISNRMVAGPDEGLTSAQGGAMGESWGDLVAAEYQFSHGYDNGGNIWAVGVYATGNKRTAIRDYSINRNPLNYSNVGFDTTGQQVHADGEIWSGTQWSVRQALVKKHDRRFPYANKGLQLRCAQATDDASPLAPQVCPGNRRWVQLMFDAFLLQQGATSMLDARDAMLAADRMRFGGEDVKVMWKAFAQRGMGKDASTPDADSEHVKGGFASPKQRNGKVTFKASRGAGKIYVGDYQARVTPVADTSPKTKLDATVQMVPGTYRMLYTSGKGGFKRFTLRVKAGQSKTVRLTKQKNLAAAANGAKVIDATEGSLNTAHLIDGKEATNWGAVTATNVDESKPFVSVDLAQGTHTIRRVQVSALLTPAPATSDPVPLATDEDPASGSRFTALRRFAIEVCTSGCDSAKASWKRIFTSKADAFPAGRPRPVAPDQTLRSFKVPASRAAAVRLVTLENQCTGTPGYAGEQDNDPLNDTDCATASDRGTIVHASELQVYAR